MPLPKDPIKAEETRRKMRTASLRKWENPEYRRKMREVHTGKIQSQETIERRVNKIKGQMRSPRIKRNCAFCGTELILLDWQKNRKFCSAACKGKWQSQHAVGEKGANWQGGSLNKICEECGKEFSFERNREGRVRFCSSDCRALWMSNTYCGENNPNWTGGNKAYCEKWNAEFRKRIRAFFDFKCAECGTPQDEELLHCHHIYYDKKACCSVTEDGKYYSNLGIRNDPHSFEIIGDPNKFIVLCKSCHAKSSGKKNRAYWARHFEEIINQYYLGKSYFTKEEFEGI